MAATNTNTFNIVYTIGLGRALFAVLPDDIATLVHSYVETCLEDDDYVAEAGKHPELRSMYRERAAAFRARQKTAA